MTQSRSDLAQRVRRAREALGLSQQALANQMGVHINTVQGWESGRRPRGKAAHDVERVLGIDLDADVVSMSPRLDDATDAQLIANLAARLAARSDEVRELRIRLDAADAAESNPDTATGRWAARTREPADNPE